ncbi:MAG: GyrI-like domain-containing protein [Candidatus Margulisbacteria bacterium]|nr:GyrI-like domain-containing protein [Candidatus Margulisiibacteriota bacterium]MBU1021575.1 GyrI-like domain-containing protein [Candidatus Margulisiibacteriota bacterium]MBU1728726.1 GyrI-like domain-containing protein [Candidatus Margulisiibacteriota bacterium]MBU1955177.1 GyrI-like domain-containing protein [Candidatus Margulisiibacteriota bacterium]
MKVLKWILIIVLVLVLLLIAFLAYMGMILPLKINETKMGPYTIAYESFTGPYAETGPVFDKVYKALKAEGIGSTRGLGIYYDNPSNVPADKLRSDCGVIIEAADLAKFNKVRRKFKIKQIPQGDCVVVEFPLRNMLSYMMGPMKVYPTLMKYIQAKGYKVSMSYELYDELQKKIYFVMGITK